MSAFVIAIDGHAACGKSTLARELARELGFIYVDSGAMYRAIALYLLRRHISHEDRETIKAHLPSLRIAFKFTPQRTELYLNDEQITQAIREQAVAQVVSYYATLCEVRDFATSLQRGYALNEKGIVMDGRDIGTAVFPQADVKFFVTSNLELRAKRRCAEMEQQGMEASLDDIKANLKERDHMDSTRAYHPLVQAKDAIVLENNDDTIAELVARALHYCRVAQRHPSATLSSEEK